MPDHAAPAEISFEARRSDTFETQHPTFQAVHLDVAVLAALTRAANALHNRAAAFVPPGESQHVIAGLEV